MKTFTFPYIQPANQPPANQLDVLYHLFILFKKNRPDLRGVHEHLGESIIKYLSANLGM